jgi:hypothetical protein
MTVAPAGDALPLLLVLRARTIFNLGKAVSLTVEKAKGIGIVSLAAERAHICQSVLGARLAAAADQPSLSIAPKHGKMPAGAIHRAL